MELIAIKDVQGLHSAETMPVACYQRSAAIEAHMRLGENVLAVACPAASRFMSAIAVCIIETCRLHILPR